MSERRTIGQVLMSFGRITDEDVERALAYQQEHGGYFGEALLALGLVTREELEWGLAAQFDLPYVFPEAESIDPAAAALVSAEWALTHLTLPIMKTSDTLTVVVDSPIKTDAVDQLQARTDLKIELALSSAPKIRELIRQVYGRTQPGSGDDSRPVPASLVQVLSAALEAGSGRFGISVRGPWAAAWYDDRGTIRRRALDGLWHAELEQVLSPAPSGRVEEGATRARWEAHLNREGMVAPVEVRYLAGPSGAEYLFRPVHEQTHLFDRFASPPASLLSEIRILARSGAARFGVSASPEELAVEILPHLPALLLDPSWRSVHVSDRDVPDGERVFQVHADLTDGGLETLRDLRSFQFDVATVDLVGDADEWVPAAVELAGAVFLPWSALRSGNALEAGVRWLLHVERQGEESDLRWSLEPVKP